MIRLGQKLHNERTRRGYSLDDVARATKIKPSFLSAIERGDYSKLPSSAYAQGFVSNYAQFLGVSKREALALFRREFDENKEFQVLPRGMTDKSMPSSHHFRIQQTMLFIAAIILFVVGYLTFQYRYAFINPPLSVSSPKEDSVHSRDITVTGRTDPNAIVFVNDTPASLNDKGEFTKQITVFPGDATITVKAQSRFGREKVIERKIEVK